METLILRFRVMRAGQLAASYRTMDGIGIEPISPVFQAGANPSQLPVRWIDLMLDAGGRFELPQHDSKSCGLPITQPCSGKNSENFTADTLRTRRLRIQSGIVSQVRLRTFSI
jgi:hypothetical protein